MFGDYTLIHWLAFFLVYCFFGWCIESTIVSVAKKKIVNRGFLHGPILPLYGSGAIVMVLSTIRIESNSMLVFIYGMIGATCLEYITGTLMEAIFKIKYWDYSKKKFNLNGYICLSSSIFWGVLTVLLVEFIHKPISNIISRVDQSTLTIVVLLVLGITIMDVINSFRKAFDLEKILDYETKIRKELIEISDKLNGIKESIVETIDGKIAKEVLMQEDRIKSLEGYIETLKSELENAKKKAGALKTAVQKSFPSATSKRFNDALQDLKTRFNK